MLKLLFSTKIPAGRWNETGPGKITFSSFAGSCSRCRNEGKCCCGTCPTACKMGWKIQRLHLWGKKSIDLVNSPGRLLGNRCILHFAGHKLNKETVIGCWYVNMKTWFKSPAVNPQSHKCSIYLSSVELKHIHHQHPALLALRWIIALFSTHLISHSVQLDPGRSGRSSVPFQSWK